MSAHNLRLYVGPEALDVPDCNCPTHDRCPECGAPPGQPCVAACIHCDAEWPRDDKGKLLKGACPGCGAEYCTGHGGGKGHHEKGQLRNPAPCPMEKEERPRLSLCEHMRNAPGADSTDEDLAEVERAMHELHGQGFASRRLPIAPTDAAPGSPERAEVMEERARLHVALKHPSDKPIEGRSVINAAAGNGNALKNGSDPLFVIREVEEHQYRHAKEREPAAARAALERSRFDAVALSYHPGTEEYEERMRREFVWWIEGKAPWYAGPKVYHHASFDVPAPPASGKEVA